MKCKNCIASLVVSFSLFQAVSFAADETDKKIEIGGMVALENGQFVKCNYYQIPMTYRPWLTREYAQLWLRAVIGEHLEIVAKPEIKLWNDTYDWIVMQQTAINYPFIQHSTVSLADAEGILSFGDSENVAFKIAAGVMPYKYNEEAKNLGEYLFRSGARPPYILTSFDYAFARLSGVRVNATMFKNLTMDLFLTEETQVQPLSDWSLSFLVAYKPLPEIEIGAGAMLNRIGVVNKVLEEPNENSNDANSYLTSTGEKKYRSFGGTKVMGRLTIDPKGFLSPDLSGMFGKEDGKLYAEAAVLGLKSYTAYKRSDPFNPTSALVIDTAHNYFADIKQRIPVMFGFNIPTFKILDYLSAELEWYGWPYPNSFFQLENFQYNNPQPVAIQSQKVIVYQEYDNWKYSFNVRKSLFNGLSIIGQISRDHTRHDVYYYFWIDQEEILSQKDMWGWWLKLQYNL